GLYNVKPAMFGRTDTLTTWSHKYGDEYSVYNGVLVNMTARLPGGLTVQGGVNTGKTVTDNCEVLAKLPENGPTDPYCHRDPGFVTRITGLGAYTIPRIDVLVSATFRSDQGAPLAANYQVPSAEAARTLGRPLAGNVPFVTVNLIEPGAVWGDRVNDLSVRVAKIVRVGRTRTNIGVDVYNVLNSDAILTYNQQFSPGGRWLVPTSIMTPRFAKVSASIDF
ncbi:MAG TPA: hypothetical protein VNI78_13060, partial [Vicinamibacterales bacterium]|nr:hypothetical protein [Vicinamibacterales bacterium]